MADVLLRFLALGFVSFGGPGAHLGYFRTTFVERLKWIDDAGYARLVALGQFLPGPGSSQVGFALGLHRAGLLGGLAAFLGFTAPSFLLMYLLSVAAGEWSDTLVLRGALHGFKLLAVVVVADAVAGMYRSFCRGPVLTALCLGTTAALWFAPSLATQFAVLGGAALVGAGLSPPRDTGARDTDPPDDDAPGHAPD
ncbi:MAG: chromate transporter, partial [Gemmatimonadetes bacterium]|nr:chromate transporter [Gemmatimonadota bacterium]